MSQKAEATYHGADIVTRLRAYGPESDYDGVMQEAASEIEKLRGRVAPRVLTSIEDILQLNALDIVLYDDSENAGPIDTYIVPDDGTVVFSTPETFHLMDGAGNYTYAWAMPLPLTVIREAA